MPGATALFSDGLDLLAEFLACSRVADDGIEATYDDLAQWRAASGELMRWSAGDVPDAGPVTLDEARLRIAVPETLWNRLYAKALSAGRAVVPDRLGLATRGAGGMLASLSAIPAMTQALWTATASAGLADEEGAAWLLLAWQPLRALLLRDRLLMPEALRPRPLFETLPSSVGRLDAAVQQHGFLLQQAGRPTQLVCPPAWQARVVGALGRHFTESVLLLFRLMFFSADQGWGWDPESAQGNGLLALMNDAHAAGLADFGAFQNSCAALVGAVRAAPPGDCPSACLLPLAAAVSAAAALWPTDYLRPLHPSRNLLAGWMTEVHSSARVAPDALLGPGVALARDCVIEAGAVLHGCARIAPGVVVPPGVVVAAGASIQTLTLSDVALPPGTVLRGSVIIYRRASIGMQVVLGADAEIGFGVAIPDGVHVADEAGVYMLHLGAGVRLPAGTVIEGSVTVEAEVLIGERVRIGNNACIRRGAFIGDGVRLPANVIVAGGAHVRQCAVSDGAVVNPGTLLYGDIALGRHALVGPGVQLGAGAIIGAGVVIPAGVTVQAGAQIDALRLHACRLPPGTVLGGSLSLGKNCRIGPKLVFEGDNRIARGLDIPGGLRIGRGARIDRLRVSGAILPLGTVVKGSVFVSPGTRLGRGVTLEDGAVVRAAYLPDGVVVLKDAVVARCDVAGAVLQRGVRIGGDLYLGRDVHVGANVLFRHGVEINTGCRIPPGVEFTRDAQVEWFSVAPDVTLPPGTRVAGSLCLRRGVRVGAGVLFGAGAVVGRGVAIPNGARIGKRSYIRQLRIAPDATLPDSYTLHGDAFIGRGASIGARAVLAANVRVGDGVALPPGTVLLSGARLDTLRIADDVVVPPGTLIGGDLVLRRGVRLGRNVELNAGADIGPHVVLPDGIVVCPDANIGLFRIAAGVALPAGTSIAGNLIVEAGVTVAPGVFFGASVLIEPGASIGSGVRLPDGVVVLRNARVEILELAPDVTLPDGTCINGDLSIDSGARIGQQVYLGAGVSIGQDVVIPDNTAVMDGAWIISLEVASDAVFTHGLNLCGSAVIGAGACIARNVVLGNFVVIGAGVHLPEGTIVSDRSRVHSLRVGVDVQLPAKWTIGGELFLEDRVVVGEGAQFGAGVVVGAGAVIGSGAVIGDDAVICAGAVIGAGAFLAPGELVDASLRVNPGVWVAPAGVDTPPAAEAHFLLWQQFLSRHASTSPVGQAEPETASETATARPAPSAPIAIPVAHYAPPRGQLPLPGPYG